MSPHERERLAAWMDGELTPGEGREVEAHLDECEECAALLANMEVVDGAVRDLPVEAPAGYFEDFPGRVRTRIEGTTRRGASERWRTPSWTWAAAAALLLGVVTPLTLARLGRDGAPVPSAEITPAKDALSQTAKSARAKSVPGSPAGNAARVPAAPPTTFDPGLAASAETIEEEPKKEVRYAKPAPVERDDAGLLAAPDASDAPVSSATSQAARPPEKGVAAPSPGVLEERTTDASLAEAEAVSVGATRSRAEAPRRQVAAFADAPDPEARADAEGSGRVIGGEADDEALARAAGVPLGATPKEGRQRRESTAAGGQAEDVQAFGRLTRNDPDGAAAWRERREAWRLFIRDHPDSPRLDEARVRVIEAGIEAWRAAGEGEDLSRARDDAEAYLAREDARQKERVRRALEDVGER